MESPESYPSRTWCSVLNLSNQLRAEQSLSSQPSSADSDLASEASSWDDEDNHIIGNTEFGTPVPFEKHAKLAQYAVKHSAGTVVATQRGPNPLVELEYMPLGIRLGMKLMWAGNSKAKFLGTEQVTRLLKRITIREGIKWNSTHNAYKHIKSFVKAYKLDCSQLLNPDLRSYRTFNEFFYRQLTPEARPQASPTDPLTITSAADCRLTVFENVEAARTFWIKGSEFNIPNLLVNLELAQELDGGSLAIFRLAPADYHRFHSPVHAVVGDITQIAGDYYTVNPAAINENLNVFTRNRRDVMSLFMPRAGLHVEIAFVAVGAMLVGSIKENVRKGDIVNRGDELGYFAYGGSTCILILPQGVVQWDDDLLRNSSISLETKVQVGECIGRFI